MPLALATSLPALLPQAIAWASAREAEILASGIALTDAELDLARRVGVQAPERIRLALVERVPMPDDPMLQLAVETTELLGANTLGLTLGYGIYLCQGARDARLVSHECRHVQQYEAAGGIAAFLPLYLQQIVRHGYLDAPYEVDARRHEIDA
ncbi:hypothetical protein SAMN02745857_02997 [Andreprevotia lacus DSM 23236]|jgi:hypothetical protein|uniref:DUF4157 domain-containing protein n=1 Tax=Andreprevotia lacus DSM 23236 TaxID=1121001 RepID=A0A1W1XVC2_9NEIS|nr:hypothetical protein [Andreprevotia lacus]SMC27856.1 hypothetical protein SAMN02745857_02997 [Andreprevotia lacus DSM 23236]